MVGNVGEAFEELVALMARLRGPDGCPWDRKQNFDSIKPYTLEETYEVLDAIDAQDWPGLCEELGDFLLQAVFFAQMAHEAGYFNIDDSLRAINAKLVRRHPHIFGDGAARTADDVKRRWDEIKATEKQAKGMAQAESVLAGVPRSLPALVEADKIGTKAAELGFDWPNAAGVLAKMEEEARELVEAQAAGQQAEIESELGDLLFNVVNLARQLKVDPEQALRKTNRRFRGRFAHVEAGLRDGPLTLAQMEERWQAAKVLERTNTVAHVDR